MIYLLEDDANIRKFVSYALENQGFKVKCFERPSLFWKSLEQELPDLLLLDIMCTRCCNRSYSRCLLQF